MRRSDWVDGRPVAIAALESVTRSPVLPAAANDAFRDWLDVIHARLTEAGLPDTAASELASVALALLKGAELLARTQGSTTPLEHAAVSLRPLTRAALDTPSCCQ